MNKPHVVQPNRAQLRRDRAKIRDAARALRTPEEQLKLIALRPGKSEREVKRLRKMILERKAA